MYPCKVDGKSFLLFSVLRVLLALHVTVLFFTLIPAKVEIAKVKKPFKFQKTSKLKKANKQIKNKHKMLTCKSANFQLFSAVSLMLGVISGYIFT